MGCAFIGANLTFQASSRKAWQPDNGRTFDDPAGDRRNEAFMMGRSPYVTRS